MALKSLQEIFDNDPRLRLGRDTLLNEQDYLHLLDGAAAIFREGSQRAAIPVTIVNDPGVLKSRRIKVVDVGSVIHEGGSGTGGTFDRVDKADDDQVAYPIWANWEIPWREGLTQARGGFDVLRETGMALTQKLYERENDLIWKGIGPLKGISTAPSIQTFAAGAAWTTAGQAWKDMVKAVDDKLGNAKVPKDKAALGVNHTDYANLKQVFSNTSQVQLDQLLALFPAGIYPTTSLPAGKAYVYARTPQVCELVVYQDLSVIPLPRVDEDERGRLRLIDSTHFPRGTGIVEVTGI